MQHLSISSVFHRLFSTTGGWLLPSASNHTWNCSTWVSGEHITLHSVGLIQTHISIKTSTHVWYICAIFQQLHCQLSLVSRDELVHVHVHVHVLTRCPSPVGQWCVSWRLGSDPVSGVQTKAASSGRSAPSSRDGPCRTDPPCVSDGDVEIDVEME